MFHRARISQNCSNHDEESLLDNEETAPDLKALEKLSCNLTIFDQPLSLQTSLLNDGNPPTQFHLTPEKIEILPTEIGRHLDRRDTTKTRWIHASGFSPMLIDDLTERYVDGHECLRLSDEQSQTFGGPVRSLTNQHFIWAQLPIHFLGQQLPTAGDVRSCTLRIVICLPTPTEAGTLITMLKGRTDAVDCISRVLTTDLLETHAIGADAVSCVWIIAMSIMRQLVEQIGVILMQFDPLDSKLQDLTHLSQLPIVLQQSNHLARIERYIASIGEILDFFDIVKSFQLSEDESVSITNPNSMPPLSSISPRSRLEAIITTRKHSNVHQLCRAYIKQYQVQMRMMLSHSTASIANKIENGGKAAERIAAVGVVLAAISGITAPFSLLTGYFGMNVAELVDGGLPSLFDFWKVAMPILALSFTLLGVLLARVTMTSNLFSR